MSATPEDAIEYMPVAQEMRQSFLEYSMSVIVSRALPDVRDGLKPVHRRILYTMHAEGLRPDRAYRKAATTVGGVMGTYHPHGDSAIYEALVRMAQPWSMRVQLIDGHGNFGSLGGEDPAAAMRYCAIGSTRVSFADNSARPRLDSLAQMLNASPNSTTDIDLKLRDRDGNPVIASKFFHSGSHPTLTLRTREGFELGGSHNHPVLCLEDISGVPSLRWKLLAAVQPGDRVVMFRGQPAEETALTERERAIAVLTGGLIAEGFSQDHAWGFANTDEVFFEAIADAYDVVVPAGKRATRDYLLPSGKRIHSFCINNTTAVLASEVGELSGYYSAQKRIPEYVWSSSLAFKRAVLQAMFEGDGSCSLIGRNSLQVAYTTISEQLARDVQQLLLEFGIVSRQTYDEAGAYYRVYICNKREARLFSERIGFWGQKQQRLEGFIAKVPAVSSSMSSDHVPGLAAYIREHTRGQKGWKRREWLMKNNVDRIERWERNREEILSRIDSAEVHAVIEELASGKYYYAEVADVRDSGIQPVYSVKVESDDHSFLADGFVNHNTEARMSQATMSMLESIDEDTVEWRPNFDGTTREPQVLPAALPNLLVNGSTGIAVGMATNMAPHNLHEVIAGMRAMLAKPDIGVDELMTHIPGPDFPTGGLVVGMDGVKEAYKTGRGIFKIRAAARIEDVSARRKGIVVTELPYTIGPERVIAKIKELINDKKLQGVADVKDLTDRKSGLRLVIECKTGFNPAALLEELYRLTPLQESFGVNNVALVNGHPRTLNLRELCHYYIEHRVEVVTRRTKFRLAKAEARAHILEGLVIALASIDEVVAIIRSSRDSATAKTKLMKQFKLSEIQAEAILEMTLRRLTSLEVTKLKDELKTLKAYIGELKKLLASEKLLRETVDTELQQVGEAFGTPRKTKLLDGIPQLAASAAALEIPDDPTVVTLTSTGLVGRSEPGAFKGTRGKHDGVLAVIATTARGQVGAITDTGRLLRAAVVEIPALAGRNRGAPVREFFPELAANERVLTLVSTEEGKRAASGLAFATANGTVKRLAPDQYPQKSGQEVIGLKEGDVLVGCYELDAEDRDLVLLTTDGQLLRTSAGAIRPQGRTAAGVAGMRLSEGASVLSFGVIDPSGADDAVVVSVSDAQAVKITTAKEYPAKGRGGAGVRMQTFRKGEEGIVVAYIGADPTAFSAGGEIVALPETRLKRDAPGVKGEVEIASISRTRR